MNGFATPAFVVFFAVFVGQLSFWAFGWVSMLGLGGCWLGLLLWTWWPRHRERGDGLGRVIPMIGRDVLLGGPGGPKARRPPSR
jgi:hypothetical protein